LIEDIIGHIRYPHHDAH
jgi:hypothetical protein